jgi:D-arabinose 1-dehydrogenase-like Zn-dependent alcohol dehydrogenase
MSVTTAQVAKELKSRAAVVDKPKAGLHIADNTIKAPKAGEVRLKVEACGVCHSDSFSLEGTFPNLHYPIVPGHEIVGTVESIGTDVKRIKPGDRVGIGWHGGHCGHCLACREGDFVCCSYLETPGITRDGGYSEYAIFPENACAFVPKGLKSTEAAPLMCAGVTTFNALRHSGARPGDVVAILGIGGLGHLAVQFANKMGFRTVAIARGDDKSALALKLGAASYINSEKEDVAQALNKLGGARVVLATATSTKAMTPAVEGLGVDGKLLIVGAGFDPLNVLPVQLLGKRKSIAGWPSGTARDSEECLAFCELTGIRPMIETFPFEKFQEAYDHMMSGKVRFRAVITF